jgi:glycosyltransferase involved in cell wall biosynthesis
MFMSDQLTESSPEMPVKPVFLVDRPVFLDYASYIRRILVGLTGTAHASAVVCPATVDAGMILCPGVEQIEYPALQMPIFWSQNRNILLDRLERFKPTILHTFCPGQIRLAQWLGHQLQLPYVVTYHKNPLYKGRFETCIHHAAKVIAPSETIADELIQKFPRLKERIECIHIGSFVEDHCCCFSRSGNVASLIVAHPLNSVRSFEPFLNAVRHLVLDGFEMMVAIMGKGKGEKAIRNCVRKLGLTSVVTVVPPIRPIRNVLGGADIYVYLSDNPHFDAQLLEAMSVGLAVVGTPERVSGLMRDGQTAAFWDPEDELNIYGCLKTMLGQRDQSRRLALNAQAHLRQHNSVSGMVDRLMNTYIEAQQWYKQSLKIPDEIPTELTAH